MNSDRIYKIFKVIMFASVFVLMITFIFFSHFRTKSDTPDRFFSERNIAENELEPSELIEEKINANTKIICHDTYDTCGHTIIYDRPQGNNGLVNFTKSQLEALFPIYEVENFNEEEVILKSYKPDRCFDCQNFVYISVYEDNVAIFYGKADKKGELKYKTDISIINLSEDTQELLKKGITVPNSSIEINTILEGLDS